MGTKGFFVFEVVINVLVSSFSFKFLWVYHVYANDQLFQIFQCGDRRQTSDFDV